MKQPGRTPGSLGEIEASPKGKRIGAFFDLDGTLIAGFSASHLSKERMRKRDVTLAELLRTLGVALNASAGRSDFEDLLRVGAETWEGRRDDELMEMGERLFQTRLVNLVYPEMREIVRAHQARGHTVVLCSSATCYQVEPVARFLGIDHVLCNRFAVKEGVLTGAVAKPVLWGKGKARVVQAFAGKHGVDLDKSYFYADGDEDQALMHLVGKPRPVNPGRQLTRVADKRGWPIQRFTSRNTNSALRSLAGVASVLPIGLAGLGLGVMKQDKRAGLNFAFPKWLETMFRINGVKFNVVGRENLWNHRPAVFIFNHRNNYDALITAMLVEKDFTGVGKKEVENHWLMGNLGKLADVAFIDRSDTKATLEQLKPIEDLARKGISISIAPEGTRLDTQEVGPFKKGAFRMAMAAGIPVVPIVIRNAEIIAARDAGSLSPGTVDVAVLPAVDVGGWKLEALSEHIETVRQQYLDTLRNWPSE